MSHSLRGVWVEIDKLYDLKLQVWVTPFGECGLKFFSRLLLLILIIVTPFGECGLKLLVMLCILTFICHSLRGVWVEIGKKSLEQIQELVTPFGECGLKLILIDFYLKVRLVTPFGECGLKLCFDDEILKGDIVTPFGECGLKFGLFFPMMFFVLSLPSGSVG